MLYCVGQCQSILQPSPLNFPPGTRPDSRGNILLCRVHFSLFMPKLAKLLDRTVREINLSVVKYSTTVQYSTLFII